MQFFKPSDVRTVECVLNNITRNGAGFATTEGGDSVFVPVLLIDQNKLDIGDLMTCYCIDQSLEENQRDDRVSARYRAVRVKVKQRLVPLDDAAPAKQEPIRAYEKPEPKPLPKPELTQGQLYARILNAMENDDRPWSSRDLADYLANKWAAEFVIPDDLTQKVSAFLHHEHREGRVAACAVRKKRDQEQPSALYYSITTDTLIDSLEGFGDE